MILLALHRLTVGGAYGNEGPANRIALQFTADRGRGRLDREATAQAGAADRIISPIPAHDQPITMRTKVIRKMPMTKIGSAKHSSPDRH